MNDAVIPPASPTDSILTNPVTPYRFGTLDTKTNTLENSVANNQITDDKTDFHFFSSAEAHLCLDITKAILKNYQTIFVELPAFAQDKTFTKRIGHYIQSPKSTSVVIDVKGLKATQILAEYVRQLSENKNSDNMVQEFATLMTSYFKNNRVLNSVIYNAQFLQTQDFDYLYELSTLIYEQFPQERHKPLIRFIFIGNKLVAPIIGKKTNNDFKHCYLHPLTHTECVNGLYLYTPAAERTESFYQTVATNAAALQSATAGYCTLLRHVLPLPIAPSLADKKNPVTYLSKYIDDKIDIIYHTELSNHRQRLKRTQELTHQSNSNMVLVSGLMAMIIMIAGYFLFFN